MGYTTTFEGSIKVKPPFDKELADKINAYCREDHTNQYPGRWCGWETDGEGIHWNGGEKFYNSLQWMEHLIQTYVKPTGRTADGTIECHGEENTDIWRIEVRENTVTRTNPQITWNPQPSTEGKETR